MKKNTQNPWKGLWSPSTWQIFENNEEQENFYDEEKPWDDEDLISPLGSVSPSYWSTSILSKYRV